VTLKVEPIPNAAVLNLHVHSTKDKNPQLNQSYGT
jgi:hypothetical protein